MVKPLAHDEVSATLELGQKSRNLTEVVGEICVRHHDVFAERCRESSEIGVAVSSDWCVDYSCPGGSGQITAAIRRAVVNSDYFRVITILADCR